MSEKRNQPVFIPGISLLFKVRHFILRLDIFSSLCCSYVLKIIKYILQWLANLSDTIDTLANFLLLLN